MHNFCGFMFYISATVLAQLLFKLFSVICTIAKICKKIKPKILLLHE